MHKLKKILLGIIILLGILMGTSTPCLAAESLTSEQQAYLRQYVLTYITEGVNRELFDYNPSHDKELSYNNKASDRGKIEYCDASFCVSMLHQALGPDLIKYDSSKGQYDLNMKATSFFNPNKNPAFVNVENEEYLQPGDVIIGEDYKWMSMIYIGINPITRKT